MGYQVWTSDYGTEWKKADCLDEAEAKTAILEALKNGKQPLLTQSINFELKLSFSEAKEKSSNVVTSNVVTSNVVTKEDTKSGAKEGKPPADKNTGG